MNKMSIYAASQLNKIISFLSPDILNKIPTSIINQIEEKTDYSIDTKINSVTDINVKKVLPETRKYLSYIFFNYLATKEEKEEYIELLISNEKRYQDFLNKKYSIENLFKNTDYLSNKNNKEELKENEKLLDKRKLGFLESVFDKIKRLFKIK